MNIEDKLAIITDDKEEVVTIVFTFEENGKKYVVFEFDDSKEISAAIYEPGKTEGEGTLLDITTDAEWDLVEKVFEQYEKDLEEADEDLDA